MMPDIQDVFLPDSSSNAAAELRRSVSARAVQNAVRDYLAANWCGSSRSHATNCRSTAMGSQ